MRKEEINQKVIRSQYERELQTREKNWVYSEINQKKLL